MDNKFNISKLNESNMDMLFLEEFASSQKFADIFLNVVGLKGAKVISTEHSKFDPVFFESDLTIIVEKNGIRYGILIEDKIDAPAMPKQRERYYERGEIGKNNMDYYDFHVFLLAPQNYIDEHKSDGYEHCISYEQLIEYFENDSNSDARMRFKSAMIKAAITSERKGYVKKPNEKATEFWSKCVEYQDKYYSDKIDNPSKGIEKAAAEDWPSYRTALHLNGLVVIQDKTNRGYVDLTFYKLFDYATDLEKFIRSKIPSEMLDNIEFLTIGKKSAGMRIKGITPLNYLEDFDTQIDAVKEHCEILSHFWDITLKLGRANMVEFYEQCGIKVDKQ